MSVVYISFNAPVNDFTMQNLIALSFDQIKQGATHLYYLMSTPGGTVREGIAAYHVIKALPVKTTMHNVGGVDSIGNALFLAGDRRKSCPHSTFKFHGVGFDITGIGRLEEAGVREKLASILSDQGKMGGIISDETSLNDSQIRNLFRKAATKDSAYALSNGLIHAVEDVIIPAGAAMLQLVFQR